MGHLTLTTPRYCAVLALKTTGCSKAILLHLPVIFDLLPRDLLTVQIIRCLSGNNIYRKYEVMSGHFFIVKDAFLVHLLMWPCDIDL